PPRGQGPLRLRPGGTARLGHRRPGGGLQAAAGPHGSARGRRLPRWRWPEALDRSRRGHGRLLGARRPAALGAHRARPRRPAGGAAEAARDATESPAQRLPRAGPGRGGPGLGQPGGRPVPPRRRRPARRVGGARTPPRHLALRPRGPARLGSHGVPPGARTRLLGGHLRARRPGEAAAEGGRRRHHTYADNAAGERISEESPSGPVAYTWDAAGRLAGIARGSEVTGITFDNLGLPASVGGVEVSWDLSGPWPVVSRIGELSYEREGDALFALGPDGSR